MYILGNIGKPSFSQVRMDLIDFHDEAGADLRVTWGFISTMMRAFRDHPPHAGYFVLRDALLYGKNSFTMTSNIDSHFCRAGFDPERLYESHGSFRWLQCTSFGQQHTQEQGGATSASSSTSTSSVAEVRNHHSDTAAGTAAGTAGGTVAEVLRIRGEFLSGKRMHSWTPSDGATEIIDGFLWLGGADDADWDNGEDDEEWLDGAGITHILNCATADVQQGNTQGRKYLLLDAHDEPGYDMIGRHWDAAREFLLDARSTVGGRVFVHCSAGINRSAIMVCAYLMHSQRTGLVEAATGILRKRPLSLANESFLAQLAQLEGKFDKCLVKYYHWYIYYKMYFIRSTQYRDISGKR